VNISGRSVSFAPGLEMKAIVAVITPTKNRLKLLCEAMDSVQQQSFDGWEHIIVDDGSDDGTAEEVERRAAADPRIRYIKRTGDKSGANVCRNLGIRQSRADFIMLLDSDDLLSQHCLAHRIEALERNRDMDFAVFPGFVFASTIEDRGRLFSPVTTGSDLDRFLYLEHPWEISGPIWRRTTLERLGLFSEQLPSWQDVDLHIRALVAGARYIKFEIPDHHIRWQYDPTKTSVRQFQSHQHLESGLAIVQTFYSLLCRAGLMTWYRRRALGGLIFLLAERWTRNGCLLKGMQVWGKAHGGDLASLPLSSMGMFVLVLFRMKILSAPYNDRLLERFKSAVGFRL
jgi:glycosyltransferase involved in cell wall biosynthesis